MSSQWENFNYKGSTDITRLILVVSGNSASALFGIPQIADWITFENDNKVYVTSVTGMVPFADSDKDRVYLPNSVPRHLARIHNLAGKDSFEMVRHLTSFNVFVRHYTQKGF